MQENLHVTVAAVIEQDERFLLVEELIQGEVRYNQPAGHLEENETLYDAVIRETLEETAAYFTPTHVTGMYQWTQPESRQTFMRISFCGELGTFEEGRQLDEGIIRPVWLTLEEIKQCQPQHRSPLVLECIYDYQQGHRYPLELIKHIV
ncbi:MAG: NUDIX hydrolase [Gammaproteobacteria bacterium]|nr:NUDIX hydrolase [Gammaproteobacteria bacterium]